MIRTTDTQTLNEMRSKKPLPEPVYTYNTESKIYRIAKEIFSLLFFPIAVGKFIHSLIGVAILPAHLYSSPLIPDVVYKKLGINTNYANDCREYAAYQPEGWKVKRITVEVDGYLIDGAILGKKETLNNRRWTLVSTGNGELYERRLINDTFKSLLNQTQSNALVFNYPSVGASTGKLPSRSTMEKAYKAMLNYLEDQEKGMGAKEIIGYGYSIGGGVQGKVLESHKLKTNINYVFVKAMTFSNLSTTISYIKNPFLGFLAKPLYWNLGSTESSKKLNAPEIIIQSANVDKPTDIGNRPDLITNDGIIHEDASLAKKLIKDKATKNKYFMGVDAGHADLPDEDTIAHLALKIKEMLA